MNKCFIKDCNSEPTFGIQSFDYIEIKDGSTKSEVIPYCDQHIEKIRLGKLKYQLHQEFHYINYELDRFTKNFSNDGYKNFSKEDLENKQKLNSRLKEILTIWENKN